MVLPTVWALFALVIMTAMAPSPAAATIVPEQPERIVAVGDLHADVAAWRAIARHAGLVDARGRWTGGRTVLVQMGDVPDRGPDSLSIVRDLMRLQREAAGAGGRVIVLVGNHEAMMMTGDLRYVSEGEYAAFADRGSARRREQVYRANRDMIEEGFRRRDPSMEREAIRAAWMKATPLGSVELQAAWHPRGWIGQWVLRNPAVARVGDTLFVHGGISSAYSEWTIERINAEVARALQRREQSADSIINNPDGPLWYRGYARSSGQAADNGTDRPKVEQQLETVLTRFGARRKVIGHTPDPSGILLLFEGRLARIDTGISAAYGGVPSYLEIQGDRLVPHLVPRPDPASPRSDADRW
ncbi:MAG: metallophosphoesterase [Thermaurantiacus sp.]